MKSAILVAAVLACSQISAGTVHEKNTEPVVRQSTPPAFAFVRGHRQAKAAHVTWGMSSNSGINRFDVESTYEDPTDPYAVWDQRGTTPNANVRSFNFVDQNVWPGTMHYRIIARMNDGTSVVSDFETIRIATH
ncbi:MAG: hypothetical protein ABIY51_13830 [Ferruginibacter sp.]